VAQLGLSFTLARRELRGGLKGFRIFLICLALGVAAIAAVGSIGEAVNDALREDGRVLLGGDVDLRLVHREIDDQALAFLRGEGAVSRVSEMRAMARTADGERRQLVELKAVDDLYPLYGEIELSPAIPLAETLAVIDGTAGAVAEQAVLDLLGVGLGDRVRVGEATYEIRAVIEQEPDRTGQFAAFGPHFMVARATLPATDLVQPGSLISYHYRLALPAGTNIGAWVADLNAAFPDAGWRIRDTRNAAPGLSQFVNRLTAYLTLVGLTALLVGGVGVAGAVRNYLDSKTETIATLKCLGGPSGLVFRTYLMQVLILAVAGIALGLMVGAVAPAAVAPLIEQQIPIATRVGLYPEALAVAALFGLLTALAFAIWPLARVGQVPAATLFRNLIVPAAGRPDRRYVLATGAIGVALAALALFTARDVVLALYFVFGAIFTLSIFRVAADLIAAAARAAGERHGWTRGRPGLRLAVANLHRPGAPLASVILSLGIGLTVLTGVALVEGNMARQIQDEIPAEAPTFFFIDIQADQAEAFDRIVSSTPGIGSVERVPSLRGRITAVDGVPVDQAVIAPDARWATRNERGLTYAASPPDGSTVVAGEWWPADYDGPPLLSFDAELAAGMGLDIGDTMTLNVLGRDVTATIANLRRIDWATLGINFTIVFAPGTLEGAPQTHIATVHVPPEEESRLLRAVTDALPNVSAIRVKDALEAINKIIGDIADAMRLTASVALIAGMLVLAGAVTAGHQRRVYDAVVLKVLGARRADVLRAFLLEYGLMGLAAGLIAAALGTLAGWAVITGVMEAEWTFLPVTVAITGAACVALTLLFGFAGTWRALNRKAAPLLRNE